ncbi:hypothetical protein BDU57DRAFT_184016 [Ampelomyces quisqualis]|uniref:Secreted protein n=1 Tax=Ampelomyces quisqualis TaxID=50730 RepID=A0A6A5QQJ4_AMPQU|nr:hypothetical protein BDU57DRAFT_184016 [Ampelomyces quisqualis]
MSRTDSLLYLIMWLSVSFTNPVSVRGPLCSVETLQNKSVFATTSDPASTLHSAILADAPHPAAEFSGSTRRKRRWAGVPTV